ncbi:hypothetical protein [Lactococcus protaetiae]|nr:hypothetical protein [Lactococcus protaetiae]MCL2114029.1 hypothetical protein [Streptococcaceae bacterium]
MSQYNLTKGPQMYEGDLQYCYKLLETINDLEKVNHKRGDLQRKLEHKALHSQSFYACIIALILPLFLVIFSSLTALNIIPVNFIGQDITLAIPRLIGVLIISIMIFLVSDLVLTSIGRKYFMTSSKKYWAKKIKLTDCEFELNKESSNIFKNSVLAENRLEDKYLSSQGVIMLIRYFETNRASFLDEAVYMLDLNIENSQHGVSPLELENIIQKERKILEAAKIF